MSNKNEVFEYLIDQLRQQVNSNSYKQQCEDLAHEVLSLKNQLRDASALAAELQEDNIRKSEHISHLTKQLALATGDVGAYIAVEQSGCRKDGVQGCAHDFIYHESEMADKCIKCGKIK